MTWEYIAGFIDGEGSITKRKRSYNIYISQANRKVLEKIRDFIGRGYVYPLTKRKAHWKNAWLYSAGSAENTHYLLSHIVDKLTVKKERALRGLDELTVRITEIENGKKIKRERIRKAKILRKKGWSYRKIGKELNTDWGYIRRLLIVNIKQK